MTLNQLMYFQKIATLGSMGKAARALHISQPSLSVSISNLEKELNLVLFHRNGHNLTLSEEGKLLLTHAESILAELQEAQVHMQMLSANRENTIRIGCITPVLCDYLPVVVQAFLSRPENKHIKVSFKTSNTVPLVEKLRDGYLDFLVCSAASGSDLLQTEVIVEPYVLICPPDADIPVSWEQLFSRSVIGFQEEAASYYEISHLLDLYGIESSYVHTAPDEATMASLVSHGFGYAIVPNVGALKNYPVQVVPLPSPNEGMVRKIYVTQLINRPAVGAAKRFLKYFMDVSRKKRQDRTL